MLINSEKKIINLGDYEIDCRDEPHEKTYIRNLFDKLLLFLVSGYMELEEKYLMDLLYVCIKLDFQKANWMDKLAGQIKKKYYSKLWDVLLLIYNNNIKTSFEISMKLMESNPEFLIDQYNQANIA